MKVIEDTKDKYGNYCIIFKSTNLKQINEWLYNHYGGEGYKFAIVIDVSTEADFEPLAETHAYFLNDLLEEVVDYIGIKEVLEELQPKGCLCKKIQGE